MPRGPAGSPLPPHLGPAWAARPQACQQGRALKGLEQQAHGPEAETRLSPAGRAHDPSNVYFESIKDSREVATLEKRGPRHLSLRSPDGGSLHSKGMF